MKNIGWTMMIYENPGFARWRLGHHVYLWHGDEEFSDLTPRISSPHVDVLSETEGTRAKARMKSIIRIVSAINVLKGNKKLNLNGGFSLYDWSKNIYMRPAFELNKEVEFEEIINPFDSLVTKEMELKHNDKNPSNIDEDYFRLAVLDPIVREVLQLVHLGEEDTLYFLVNTYKILENILHDLNLGKSNGKVIVKDSSHQVSQDLIDAANEMLNYTQYINSKKASGFLARHGAGNTPAPQIIPSLEDIKISLLRLVNEWLKFKCSIMLDK